MIFLLFRSLLLKFSFLYDKHQKCSPRCFPSLHRIRVHKLQFIEKYFFFTSIAIIPLNFTITTKRHIYIILKYNWIDYILRVYSASNNEKLQVLFLHVSKLNY